MFIKDKINSGIKLSPSERQLADYILEYPDRFLKMSILEVSKQLYVSKSTIIRFAKKLGFVGHKDLCLSLAKELSIAGQNDSMQPQTNLFPEQISAETVVDDVLKLYNHVLITYCENIDVRQLKRIADMIAEKKRLILFGLSDAYLIASDFQYKLMEIGIDAILPVVPDIFWKVGFNVKDDDLTLIISLKGDYRDLLDLTSMIQRRGSRIILLDGSGEENLSVFAEETILLSCSEEKASMRRIAYRTLASFILDIIYLLIYLQNSETAE